MKTPKKNFSIVQTSKFVNEMTKYDLTNDKTHKLALIF
jgi:hypothetical protein